MFEIRILTIIAWLIAVLGLFYNNYPKSPGSYQHAHAKNESLPSQHAKFANAVGVIVALMGFSTGNFPLGIGVFLPCLILSIVDLITIYRIEHQTKQKINE